MSLSFLVFAMVVPFGAFASFVDATVFVDAVAPNGVANLRPGESEEVTVTFKVSGAQASGTNTFTVNTRYVLDGGAVTESDPVAIEVPVRPSGQTPDWFYYVRVRFTVASSDHAGDTGVANIGADSVIQASGQGGKLSARATLPYIVNVIAPVDTTPPNITVPAGITAEATSESGAVVTFSASAVDDLDGPVTVTCVPASGSTFEFGTTVVTATASDSHGNTATRTFNVTVADTTRPVVSANDVTVEAVGASGATATLSATAYDSVDGALAVSFDHAADSVYPLGTTDVVASATDSHGNRGSATLRVNVIDSSAPLIDAPDITVEADRLGGAVVDFAPTATDLVDGIVPVTCDPASGSMFAVGTMDVTANAVDHAGNRASLTFHVTVTDHTPPAITVPADITAEAAGPEGATVNFDTSAVDLVDGAVDAIATPASGSTFPLGSTVVTVTAHDAHGNSDSKSFTVNIVDTTAPDLVTPDVTVEALGPLGTVVPVFPATAYDLVDGPIAVLCIPPAGTVFPVGTTTVQASATDQRGNGVTGAFKVNVVDTTPPVITVPADITAEAAGPGGATVTFDTSAVDLVDGNVDVVAIPASGSTFPLGPTAVTVTAHDEHRNSDSKSFTVNVVDTTAPDLTVPGDIVVQATSAAGAAVNFTTCATDLVDGSCGVTCSKNSGETFPIGSTTVTACGEDAHHNRVEKSFKVTVVVGFGDFGQPINTIFNTNPYHPSVFKLGSTIPVKFTLSGASAGITGIAANLYVLKTANYVPVDGVLEALASSSNPASPGSAFRYDAGGGQYIYNLGTKNMTEGTYRLRIDLGDGQMHTVDICLKK